MRTEKINRRLAAILAADVVGYSRMMGADEAGTLAALKIHRDTLFDPTVAAHGGRIVKLMGDGTLVEFSSVVDAVKCALAIQTAIKSEAQKSNIKLRIGINLGDVIIEGDDIYGDGVNVAARLEPLADPGGVCISSIVHDSVGNRVDITFADGGEVEVKNIARPIRVWKWHPDGGQAAPAPSPADGAAKKPQREIPSIAVLPFDNMSGDPEQEYFSDGITEDIITDLSKVGGLLVIARNSSFAYKGKNPDIRLVGRELGVRSVLEGSIRRAGNRVRITAQLINTADGGHLWAERYDRDLTDIFAVQDEVTHRIVDALKVTLTPSEEANIAKLGTADLDAHDRYLRARERLFGGILTREAFSQATKLLDEAIKIDPGYAEAYAALGFANLFDFVNRWTSEHDRSIARARQFGQKAIELDPTQPLGHVVLARAAFFNKELELAAREANVALSLNPNFALAYNLLGGIEAFSSDPLKAVPLVERAMRLDPAFSHQYLQVLGTAYLLAGKYEAASAIFRQRILMVPETDFSRAFLASALGHLGMIEEAREIWRELRAINPNYSFAEHVGRLPFRSQADVDRVKAGLVAAGLID